MLKKKTLAVTLAAVLLSAGLTLGSAPSNGSGSPPLLGVFKDNFTLSEKPVPAPATGFQDAQGRGLTLVDFAGKVVLLNFWATWCPPCIREMPSLDRLQAALGKDGLEVVAVSLDRDGLEKVVPFFEQLGLANLEVYLDTKSDLARDFEVMGLPMTFLIDRQGQLVGDLQGPAEWDEPDAVALIRHYLKQRGPKANDAMEPIETSG